jgi:hypothetical protein
LYTKDAKAVVRDKGNNKITELRTIL